MSTLLNNIDSDILKQMHDDILLEHLDLISEHDLENLVSYYQRGKTHLRGYNDIDIRYMKLAKEISTWSKDPSTKIGAIAISENNQVVLSQGYNGFPRKIKDDYRLYIRKLKYDLIIHAEMNVIYNAVDNGISLAGSTVYVYGLPPCSHCTSGLIQAGVVRVVYCNTKNVDNWNESFKLSTYKLIEANIQYREIKEHELNE